MPEWKIVGLAFFLLCSEPVTDEDFDWNTKKRDASVLNLHVDHKWVRKERCEGEACFVRCCLHAMRCVHYSSVSRRKAFALFALSVSWSTSSCRSLGTFKAFSLNTFHLCPSSRLIFPNPSQVLCAEFLPSHQQVLGFSGCAAMGLQWVSGRDYPCYQYSGRMWQTGLQRAYGSV